MLDLDSELLDTHPDWRHVLFAYRETVVPTSATDSELSELFAKGFRPRLRVVEGVPSENMTRIHGKLIAHGLLQVEIASRTGGMLYQLTSLGRQACVRLARVSVDVEETETTDFEMNADEESLELATA
jgi:hypothetical protein